MLSSPLGKIKLRALNDVLFDGAGGSLKSSLGSTAQVF